MREQLGEFDPFPILTAAANLQCQGFEPLKRFNLDLQFRNRPCGSGLINDFLLSLLQLVIRCLVDVLDVFLIERRSN